MIDPNYLADFSPGDVFHVVAEANDGSLLFPDRADTIRYKQKLFAYLGPFADIHVYALMGNHLHLKIQICQIDEIRSRLENVDKDFTPPHWHKPFGGMISEQFRRLNISHAMYINWKYTRRGNLFHRPLVRILVDSDLYSFQLDAYILCNPDVHGVGTYDAWADSSFRDHVGLNQDGILPVVPILDRYHSLENLLFVLDLYAVFVRMGRRLIVLEALKKRLE